MVMNGACWDIERKDREKKGDILGMLKIVEQSNKSYKQRER